MQSSHTDIEEIFFEQDNNMGDQDDRNTRLGGGSNTGPDQGNVMFRRLLDTLEEGQRMQQEHNRQMDMMLQLMARQMGININPGDANNGNNNNGGNDNNRGNDTGGRGNNNGFENNIISNNGHDKNGNETRIEPPSYDVGDVGVLAELVDVGSHSSIIDSQFGIVSCVQSQESTYETLSRDGDASIVGLGECEDTIISATTFVSVEPSKKEFSSMHAIVDVCSNDGAHVDDYEFSSLTDPVQFFVVAVSVVPMSTYFDVATPIVDTVGMSAYGSPVTTSFSMPGGDDHDSSPICIMWVDTRKKRFHISSTELPSILTSTSSTQVLGARLQDMWLVLMMLVCSWFNVHRDVTLLHLGSR